MKGSFMQASHSLDDSVQSKTGTVFGHIPVVMKDGILPTVMILSSDNCSLIRQTTELLIKKWACSSWRCCGASL